MAERSEKIKEKIVNRRENKGIFFRKKVAIKLFKRRIIMEKVGSKNNEVAAASWLSPQGRE